MTHRRYHGLYLTVCALMVIATACFWFVAIPALLTRAGA